ncbi:hypothetical protein ACFQXB_01885 [Plastorhodobacter daqingensis]|uniref:Argininosuccinate lyase n=1 Tax=Plastorhodobacter daqingensis TaxID=1387281 RepID=A0ABW2UHE8_9RHOB
MNAGSRLVFALLSVLLVAACGADGPPREVGATWRTQGPRSATGTDIVLNADNRTGVSVSGEARIGVVGRL